MKLIKPIISILLAIISIFLVMGAIYAPDTMVNGYVVTSDPIPGFDGDLGASLNETTFHVGDTVALTIHPHNYGESDWENILIYAPIPKGFKYLSHVVPNRTMQDYNPSTGIWNVQQMLHGGRGADKELIITLKVLPGAAGTHVIFSTYSVKFKSLISVYPTGVNSNPRYYNVVASQQAPGNPRPITVTALPEINDTNTSKNDTPSNGPGEGPGVGPGSGPSIGPKTGNGTALVDSLGNTKLADVVGKLVASEKNDPLKNLQTGGGGGNGKAREVSINPPVQDNTLGMYILAALLIIGLLAAGYFYGIKREE